MKNKDRARLILNSVPHERGKPMFIPLNHLPEGVEITIITKDAMMPLYEQDHHEVNGEQEDLVTYLPAGHYVLEIMEWGVVKLTTQDNIQRLIKPLYDNLAVSSTFTGNYDENRNTFRLQTGIIEEIRIIGICRLTLDEMENPVRTNNRRGRQHRPSMEQYSPLGDRN